MKIISHRGNFLGANPETENNPNQIDYVIDKGFDVEIDLWIQNNKLFLGHDKPIYEINEKWLFERTKKIWVHLKNINSIYFVSNTDLNYFWHENDKFTLTSKNIPWCYPGIYIKGGITVVTNKEKELFDILGICTDYTGEYL